MSYDLIMTSNDASDADEATVADAVTRVLRVKKGLCDIVALSGEGGRLVSTKMPSSDADTAKAYRALVKLAKQADWRISDPQAGSFVELDAPGRYPPGWVPTRPSSGKSMNARVKQFVTEDLRASGFLLRGKRTAFRPREGFEEKLEFTPGRGRFTVDVCWFFPSPLAESFELHGNQRIGRLISGVDTWYPDSPQGFDEMRADVTRHVLPRFAKYATIESVVEAIERGELAIEVDPGWSRYRLAYLYLALERPVSALQELRAVVDEHSKNAHRLHLEQLIREDAPAEWIAVATKTLEAYEGGPDDWVYRREQAVRAVIAELEASPAAAVRAGAGINGH